MKVAICARVSSDSQDVDLSLSAQLKALRDYAAKQSYQVVREFVEEAESGCTDRRPYFREMISLARRPNKPFKRILVWKYSRFARSREDSILYKAMNFSKSSFVNFCELFVSGRWWAVLDLNQ